MHSSTIPSTYQGSSLAKRLNIVGTVTCILDTAINLSTRRSETVSKFINDVIPYYVSASYYILPTAGLSVLFFKNLFAKGCRQSVCVNEEAEEKARSLLEELNEVDGFKVFIEDNPAAQEALMTKVKAMQANGYMDKVDIFINILYFALRAFQGIAIIIKANELTSGSTNQEISEWTDFISNVINAAYLLTMLIHNNCHKHTLNRHTLFATKQTKIESPQLLEPNVDGQHEEDRLVNEVIKGMV